MPEPARERAALPAAADLAATVARLQRLTKIQTWIGELRGWRPDALAALNVGWGNPGLPCMGDRFVLPMHDAAGELVNVRGYMPTSSLKLVGLRGRPIELWPTPELTWPTSGELWVVEGEPDAIAARGGWPMTGTIAVPGASTWRPEWGARLARWRRVHTLFDADDAGRMLGERVAHDLAAAGADHVPHTWEEVTGGSVADGFDLTDWLLANPGLLVPPV
ncbi:MAG: toprim domain-containing protein [Solirubrobacteraceae bacterium]|nr:toprim domain-containing protein [Solirubrobacteraceae bacterium]